jgi:hypothetical protein
MARGLTTAPSSRSLSGSYTQLFNVRFQHDYYNVSGGMCPDFKVVPTPDCTRLMTTLGMLFKDHGTGFSVLIDQSRVPALIAYVLGRYWADAPGAGYWSWLSFLLVPANPAFVGITSLPITINPMAQNLHLSNLATSEPDTGDAPVLSGSAAPQTLYPVTGPNLTVPAPPSGAVLLTGLSGAAVSAPSSVSADATSFNLANLPYGYYALGFTNAAGKRVAAPRGYAAPLDYLYVPPTPLSLCVLDLLLTQPAKGLGDPAAFPIPPLPVPSAKPAAPPTAIDPVTLVLPFQARGTYWRYYIVAQDGTGQLGEGMQISGTGATFTQSKEQLPNGDHAVLFTAGTALPLQQQSQYRFQLTGQRHGANGSRDAINVARLPTAPAAPVWPAPSGEALAGASEIYVYV